MALNIRKLVLTFVGRQEQVLVQHRMMALPIREDQLISKSIEYFDDPEPCMIHRSAVTHRLYTEILDFLASRIPDQGGTVSWADFPESLAAYIALPEPQAVYQVRISLTDR